MTENVLAVGTNQKLGKRVGSISRPVGPTCPGDCPFLTGITSDGQEIPLQFRCYAESIQARFKEARAFAQRALRKSYASWVKSFVEAVESKRNLVAIRIHVGGDFLAESGELDTRYIRALLVAFKRLREGGNKVPAWYYTHCWKEMAGVRDTLKALGVIGYASVHNVQEADQALLEGWRLALTPGVEKTKMLSGFREVCSVRALNCPEQVKGSDRVTCETCKYCWTGKGHVIFGLH